MATRLIFYNHHGSGDLHESREFVRDMVKIIPADKYFYAHGKDPEILSDICQVKYTPLNPFMDSMSPFLMTNNALYINTWIGRDSKYVLRGIGCTLGENYRMFNDILSSAGIGKLSRPVDDYIPVIDYSYYKIGNIKKFLEKRAGKRVLISNGNVLSKQAYNFDFSPIIILLVNNYPSIDFIVTRKIDYHRENLFTTKDIILSDGICDLNEISYLSTFCNIIIGRSSGPFLFCQTRENWMNPDKTFLSLTYTIEGSNIVHDIPVLARKYWSSATNTDDVFRRICEVIE